MKLKKNKLDHARWSKWPSVPMIKKKKNQTCGLCVYAIFIYFSSIKDI